MRETRYAVMALAEAFPRPGVAACTAGETADSGPARLPRTDSLVNTLDDLENLWDVPEPDRGSIRRWRSPRCSKHPQPLVRALRPAPRWADWGRPSQPRRLAGRLADPSKIVWRAAAWALAQAGERRTGHRGHQAQRSMTTIPACAAGPLEFSPISSTGWTSAATWPIA